MPLFDCYLCLGNNCEGAVKSCGRKMYLEMLRVENLYGRIRTGGRDTVGHICGGGGSEVRALYCFCLSNREEAVKH